LSKLEPTQILIMANIKSGTNTEDRCKLTSVDRWNLIMSLGYGNSMTNCSINQGQICKKTGILPSTLSGALSGKSTLAWEKWELVLAAVIELHPLVSHIFWNHLPTQTQNAIRLSIRSEIVAQFILAQDHNHSVDAMASLNAINNIAAKIGEGSIDRRLLAGVAEVLQNIYSKLDPSLGADLSEILGLPTSSNTDQVPGISKGLGNFQGTIHHVIFNQLNGLKDDVEFADIMGKFVDFDASKDHSDLPKPENTMPNAKSARSRKKP
jgi:hypothetical protein